MIERNTRMAMKLSLAGMIAVFSMLPLWSPPARAQDADICTDRIKGGNKVEACTRAFNAGGTPANRAEYLAHRGNSYLADRAFDKAMADYEAGVKLDARCARCYAGRAGYYLLAVKQYDLAIRDANKALELLPGLAIAITIRDSAMRQRR